MQGWDKSTLRSTLLKDIKSVLKSSLLKNIKSALKSSLLKVLKGHQKDVKRIFEKIKKVLALLHTLVYNSHCCDGL